MNKKIISLALMFLMPIAVVAEPSAAPTAAPVTAGQNAGSAPAMPAGQQPADNHENKFDALAAKLNLTEAQKAQLKPIFEQRREQVKALKQQTNPLQRKLAVLALMQETNKDVEKVLTPEQLQQFNAIKQEQMLGKHHVRENPTPPAQTQVH